jgi:cellulase (glycosyl hydrolase family 5)
MRKYSPLLCLLAFAFCSSSFFGQSNAGASASSIEVNVSPETATITSSETLQLTALVKNTPNVAVAWSASVGTISSSGIYRPPKAPTDTAVTIRATSVSDPTKSATASLLVTAPQYAQAQSATTATTTSATIKQSFFGADFNGFGIWPPTDGQKQVATLGSIRLWDDGVKWAQVETSKGVYDWAKLDTWISKAQAQGVDVLYTIGDTPKWAGSIPKGSPCGPNGQYSCSAPTDVKTDGTGTDKYFSDFMTALVKRYKGQIAYYELWNEPDCKCFWSGTTAQLVRMGQDAAAIIRANDSAAKILSPSAHGPTMKSWFDDYVAAGGAANFDIVNAHLRGTTTTNKDPESFLTMYDDVTAETSKRNLTKLPIWDDEHGIREGEMTDPDKLAGHVARSVILRAGVGLQRQYIYTWDDNPPYGLQGNDSGTAWDTVAGWLIGHTISPCTVKGTVYTCTLDNGLIVWDTAQTCSNGTCTTSKYTYSKTYTKKTDLTGTKTSLSGTTVSIGYKPILLTSK